MVNEHNPTHATGLYNMRPVVASQLTMELHLKSFVADILEPVAKTKQGSWEVTSTNEMLAQIDMQNKDILDRKLDTRLDAPGLRHRWSQIIIKWSSMITKWSQIIIKYQMVSNDSQMVPNDYQLFTYDN